MFQSFSKILPLLVYPLGLACIMVFSAFFIKQSRWQKAALAIAFLFLFGAGNQRVSLWLARSLEWRYFPPQGQLKADVIVILESDTHAAEFPRAIPEIGPAGDRFVYAAYLYRQGAAPLILYSGGPNTGEVVPFLLGIMGVPRDAILLETNSYNTYENAANCRRIIEEKSLQQVILVTSASHMPRAVGVFQRQGIEVIPAPTGYSVTEANADISSPGTMTNLLTSILPSAENLDTTTFMIKEYIGILVYKLRGWL